MSKNHADNLIKGLLILKGYKPSLQTYASRRANMTLEIQEVEFGDIADEHKARLLELGWETNDAFIWRK